MAHGRVGQNNASFPVLTGMPVAGMAYLDRPSPGGYFIFPDLSVRHEGKFRLSFNLFEELKESKDEDTEPARSSPDTKDIKPPRALGTAPKSHALWRLEVKSFPFSVYSAKKFPGLAESTNLSRVVAEQGCRVRIRRDVRMRRRDNKSKDYDELEESGYARTDRFATPAHQVPDRPRSISNGSVHSNIHGSVHGSVEPSTPYAVEHRRSSQDLGYTYSQTNFAPAPAPPQPVQNTTYTSHLNFGPNSSQYSTSSFQPPSVPMSHPSQRYVHGVNDYQYPSNAHSRQMSTSQNFAYPPSQPQTPTYQQPQTPIYPSSTGEYKSIPDYGRASLPPSQPSYSGQPMNQYKVESRHNSTSSQMDGRQTYSQVDTRQNPTYPHVDARQSNIYPPADSRQPGYYTSPSQNQVPRSVTPSSNSHILPPIHTIQPAVDTKHEVHTPTSALPTPSTTSNHENHYHRYQPTYTPASTVSTNPTYDPARIQGKRSHDQVFDSSHQYQSVHSGMRPATLNHGQDVPQIEADDGTLVDEYDIVPKVNLVYRRADGTRSSKKCPSLLMD